MCNIEIDAATVTAQETSLGISSHDIVTLVLFAACLTLGVIQMINSLQSFIKHKYDWSKKPVPSKIKWIARGILGWTITIYIIGLVIFWGSWKWSAVYMTFVISFFSGFGFSLFLGILFLFGYYLLYKPIIEILSDFKRK